MANERVLPDLKTRVRVDSSQLQKLPGTAASAGAAIKAGMQTSTTHTLRFQQSLTTLLDHFGGMPPVANEAARSIESMASQGVRGLTLLGGGALVAAGAIAEIVKGSMDTYRRIGGEVENFRRVSGASAEDSSRLVHVFNALGLESGVAEQAVFKLSKAIETSPAKLRELGIEIERDTKGNVDFSQTLFSIADAYNATADPARRNLILFTAFGKSGRDMIPVLEQGSASLRRMEASASLLFSAADLERLKQMEIHTREVKSAWDEWWAATVGRGATEAQNKIAESFLANAYAAKQMNDQMAAGTQISRLQEADGRRLLEHYRKEYYATQQARESIDQQTEATKRAVAENAALVKSLDDVTNHEATQRDAAFALTLANIDVQGSQDRVTQASQAYAATVKQYGADSIEARNAARDYQRAVLDQEKAYHTAADAEKRLAEETDVSIEGQRNASREAQVYIDKLQAEADSLAPDAPLRKYLQDYINDLKTKIPRDVTTVITATYRTSGRIAREEGYAEGGRPQVGRDVWVGEGGPERARFDSPVTVYRNGTQPPAPGDGGAGGMDTTAIESLLAQLIRATGRQVVELNGEVVGRVVDRRVVHQLSGLLTS